MHKGIIMITKANSRDDAQENVAEFLDGYGDGQVWDWYVVGGRWSRMLNSLASSFEDKAPQYLKSINLDSEFISSHDIKVNGEKLQKIWEDMGGSDTNPWQKDTYAEDGHDDDIMPLKDCLDIVKEYGFDPIQKGKEELKEAENRLNDKEDRCSYSTYGYCLKIAGSLFAQDFCFDCNVYNIETYDYSIPKDIEGYYAVVIDMHN